MSEPFNDESKIDKKRVDTWLSHYDLERIQSHCSGHSKGQDLLDAVKSINAKILFPVHTEHPETYKKVAKSMVLVDEGISYRLS